MNEGTNNEKKFIKTNKNALSRIKKQKSEMMTQKVRQPVFSLPINAVALYDYNGDYSQSQLSFRKGDNITVNSSHSNGWSYATLSNDNNSQISGYIPTSYISQYPKEDANNMTNGGRISSRKTSRRKSPLNGTSEQTEESIGGDDKKDLPISSNNNNNNDTPLTIKKERNTTNNENVIKINGESSIVGDTSNKININSIKITTNNKNNQGNNNILSPQQQNKNNVQNNTTNNPPNGTNINNKGNERYVSNLKSKLNNLMLEKTNTGSNKNLTNSISPSNDPKNLLIEDDKKSYSSESNASNDTNTNDSNNDSDSHGEQHIKEKRPSNLSPRKNHEFHTINSNPFEASKKKSEKHKVLVRSQSIVEEEFEYSTILSMTSNIHSEISEIEDPSVPKISVEPEIVNGNECVITGLNGENFVAGTLRKVVEWLIFREKLPENKENFLLCFRDKFVSCSKLLLCLVNIYKGYRQHQNKERIFHFISLWISKHYDRDWVGNNDLIDKLLSFMKSNFIARENQVLINTIKLDLVKFEHERQKTVRINQVGNKKSFLTFNTNEAFFQYLKYNSKVLAEQITRSCFLLFSQLKPSDMFCRNRKISKNMELFCSHSLEISAWILNSFELLNKRKHPNNLKKFIKISNYLYKLRNFNSLYAFINTLSSEKIQSLQAWQNVSRSYMQKYSKFEKLFSPVNSFQNYKDSLLTVMGNSISLRPPIMPFFAIYMKSIRYIDRKIDSHTDNSFINYKKVQLLGSILREIGSFQKKSYGIDKVDTVYDFVASIREHFLKTAYLNDVKSYFLLDGKDDIISPKYDCKENYVIRKNPMYGTSPKKMERVKKNIASPGTNKVEKEKPYIPKIANLSSLVNNTDGLERTPTKFVEISYFLEDENPIKHNSLAFGISKAHSSTMRGMHKDEEEEDDKKGADITNWGNEKVDKWLSNIGLGEYSKNFLHHSIRGDQLVMLSENDLKMLGVTKLGHRKKILKEIRSKTDPNVLDDDVVIPKLNFQNTENSLLNIFKRRNSTEMGDGTDRNELDNESQELRSYGLSPRNESNSQRRYSKAIPKETNEDTKDGFSPKKNNNNERDINRSKSVLNIFSDDDYDVENPLQDTDEIWVKGYYKNECRLLRIKKDIEIPQLEKKFAKEFKKRVKFSIKFKDTEGDFISITKKTDLQYAILNSQGIIKLHLFA